MAKARRIPLQTVHHSTERASRAASKLFYIQEIDRQAEIASDAINTAIAQGYLTEDPRDIQVWTHLQSAMFAAICIVRLVKPSNIQTRYAALSRTQSQQHASERGRELRELLDIEDDSVLYSVVKVRNSFEHFDERIDAQMTDGADCISDWYISDGPAAVTVNQEAKLKAVGLRVFFPAGGVLYFEDEAVDLFALDIALLNVRIAAKEAETRLKTEIEGRGIFGGQLVQLMTQEQVTNRSQEWIKVRNECLRDLDNKSDQPSNDSA